MVALRFLLASLPLMAAFAGSLVSAASCIGSACKGKDPVREGCDKDGVVQPPRHEDDGSQTTQVTVKMVYSQACRAWWALATCNGPHEDNSSLFVNLWQFYGGRSYKQRLVGTSHSISCSCAHAGWTYMLDDRTGSVDVYDACWDIGFINNPPDPSETGGGALGCTGRTGTE
jgi:hypothetical protein